MIIRLRRLAVLLCGEQIATLSVDPLLADWARELEEVRGLPGLAKVFLAGCGAFLCTTCICGVRSRLWKPPLRGAGFAIAAFGGFVVFPVVLQDWLRYQLYWNYVTPFQSLSFVLRSATVWMGAAALPALFMLRRDTHASWRHAVTIAGIVVGITLVVGALTTERSLRSFFSSPAWMERQYGWSIANDLRGHYDYPGTAVRQIRQRSFQERQKSYAQVQAMVQRDLASNPPTLTDRLHIFLPAAIAGLLAAAGWALAGLATPSVARAATWWILTLLLALVTNHWSPLTQLLLFAGVALPLSLRAGINQTIKGTI